MLTSFGPLYVTTVKYPPKFRFYPLIDNGWTSELDEPYRKGKCLVFKLPAISTGLGIGIWTDKVEDEEEALMLAIGGSEISLEDLKDV